MKQVRKTRLLAIVLILLFSALKAVALDYTINFTGSGASSTVENVIVQNLTKGTQTTVPAGSVLRLSDQTNGVEKPISDTETMKIVPTPEEGKYNMSFYSPNTGVTQISAYSLDGRKLAGINTNLQIGENSFQLSLPQGLYVVRVAGNGYSYSEKLVNQVGVGVNPGIAYAGMGHAENHTSQKSKGVASVFMSYTTGDMLLYKGVSGNYSTIVTDVPTASKTTSFNFVECKDASGNYYTIVKIGNQTWMAENLRTTKYRTGDDIVNLVNNSDWGLFSISSWCNYNNEAANATSFGRLYNWYAVSDNRNIAPIGWHVASDAEWTVLTTTLNGESLSGGKLKETGLSHWVTPNTAATNEAGFSALPGGSRLASGQFYNQGNSANWWSITENGTSYAWYRSANASSSSVQRDYYNKNTGFSVRCVKDADLPTVTTVAPTSITYTTAIGGGNITSDGGAPILDRGICWSTTTNPTIANSKSSAGTGTGAFTASIMGLTVNTTYYVRAYATNSSGTSYGEQLTFKSMPYNELTVADIDGNVYHTITIGTQTWMVENLKSTRYNDGSTITYVPYAYDWPYATNGGYCWTNGSIANKELYGAMYNWYAVSTGKLAPMGWHVPSKSEVETLVAYLGGTNVAGSKLKEIGNLHWITGNSDATNSSGFTALPGGYRSSATGDFQMFGITEVLWTATELSGASGSQFGLDAGTTQANIYSSNKLIGCNVRCVKNTIPYVSTGSISSIMSTTISALGNVVSDGGEAITEKGLCWSTSSNPTVSNSKTIVGSGIGSFSTIVTGLTPNTTYYVRAYATNSLGTAYGQEMSFKTLLTDPVTVTDIDGNVYHTVTIGTQTWMVENLKTTKYNNGTSISYVSSSYDWTITTAGGYCWPNGSVSNKEVYGAMYNWYAASTGKLAPTGWHVPAKSEVETLVAYLGGTNVAGSKLKESGNQHWISGNFDATNSSGFSALPGGYRSSATGDYQQFGVTGVWWSTAESSGTVGYHLGLESSNTLAVLNSNNKLLGCNVRCLKNSIPAVSTNSISSIMSTTISASGNVIIDGGETVTEYGVCWSTSTNPTIANSKKSVGTGIGSFSTSITGLTPNTTYYVRAYATNALGTAYGEPVTFKTLLTDPVTVTDADGNVYHTVTIGTQTWMVENLKTTKYNDGTSIPLVTDSYQWTTIATPGYCWTNNDISNKDVYGAMYNFYAVNTGKLAPAGWHVPTESDWMTLANYMGGLSASGSTLKEVGTTHWSSPNTDATNSTGFTALPGGYRASSSGNFINMGNWGCWWASTITNGSAWRVILTNITGVFDYQPDNLKYGFNVRCIKNSLPVISTNSVSSIMSTSITAGGNVSSDGGETITEYGICWSTSSNPTIINSKKVIGSGIGSFSTTVSGLTPNTTYYLRAYATNNLGTSYGSEMSFTTLLTDPITVTDIDGNLYHTITIGAQTWMVENLKTTRYNDGTSIPLITSSQWISLSSGGYCWPNSNSNNMSVYGGIYNFYAVSTGKLAPTGWHVATQVDYNNLVNYLGGFQGAGAALKESGYTHWISPNTGASNSSGFTAIPAGYRSPDTGDFINFGTRAVLWSSTELAGQGGRFIIENNSVNTDYSFCSKTFGFSVKCVKD